MCRVGKVSRLVYSTGAKIKTALERELNIETINLHLTQAR
jgi:hypothetical protein